MPFLAKTFYTVKNPERNAYQYERRPERSVSLQSLNYHATERISSLAKPKIRKETTIREGQSNPDKENTQLFSAVLGFSRYESNPTYSGVTPAATHARCSSRLSDLSSPIKRHVTYQFELPLPRPIPHKALKYVASTRISELAMPKQLPGV